MSDDRSLDGNDRGGSGFVDTDPCDPEFPVPGKDNKLKFRSVTNHKQKAAIRRSYEKACGKNDWDLARRIQKANPDIITVRAR